MVLLLVAVVMVQQCLSAHCHHEGEKSQQDGAVDHTGHNHGPHASHEDSHAGHNHEGSDHSGHNHDETDHSGHDHTTGDHTGHDHETHKHPTA